MINRNLFNYVYRLWRVSKRKGIGYIVILDNTYKKKPLDEKQRQDYLLE